MAAIRELEARSRAFMREKQEKKKLEHRISVLQGQMLIGGGIMDTPAFRNAIKEHQEKIRAVRMAVGRRVCVRMWELSAWSFMLDRSTTRNCRSWRRSARLLRRRRRKWTSTRSCL